MFCLLRKKVLFFIMLLFLLSFYVFIIFVLKVNKEINRFVYFIFIVEFVVNIFNQESQDEYVYRMEYIMSFWREKVSVFFCFVGMYLLVYEELEKVIYFL